MRIKYENGKILLDQTDYLRKILKRFGMIDARMAKTPLPTGYKPEPFEGTSTQQFITISVVDRLPAMSGLVPSIRYSREPIND